MLALLRPAHRVISYKIVVPDLSHEKNRESGCYGGDGDSRISCRFGDFVSFNCTDALTASLTELP
jgi:hypothetical protein